VRIWFAGGGTAGHLNPGLAIARAMVKMDPADSPFVLAAKRGIERDLQPKDSY
jgi:UDP-N-acetylglucosamine--N-acetylmuramyl-(pentapeptide) pyrophosphoryl-undecaprenol N-acetylglucosamine transferase